MLDRYWPTALSATAHVEPTAWLTMATPANLPATWDAIPDAALATRAIIRPDTTQPTAITADMAVTLAIPAAIIATVDAVIATRVARPGIVLR